jgi:hypothetical protein
VLSALRVMCACASAPGVVPGMPEVHVAAQVLVLLLVGMRVVGVVGVVVEVPDAVDKFNYNYHICMVWLQLEHLSTLNTRPLHAKYKSPTSTYLHTHVLSFLACCASWTLQVLRCA